MATSTSSSSHVILPRAAKEEQDQDRAYAPVRADVFLRLSVAESQNRIQYDSIYSMSTLMGVASAQ